MIYNDHNSAGVLITSSVRNISKKAPHPAQPAKYFVVLCYF